MTDICVMGDIVVRVACLWGIEITISIPVSYGLSMFFLPKINRFTEFSCEMCDEQLCLALIKIVCKLE